MLDNSISDVLNLDAFCDMSTEEIAAGYSRTYILKNENDIDSYSEQETSSRLFEAIQEMQGMIDDRGKTEINFLVYFFIFQTQKKSLSLKIKFRRIFFCFFKIFNIFSICFTNYWIQFLKFYSLFSFQRRS